MRWLLAALLLAAFPANAAAPLSGTWFGSGQPWDRSAMYIDTMSPDGSFHAHHRFCSKGKASDQYERGRWSLKGDHLTIVITQVDGWGGARTDEYRVLSHDAHQQRYVYLPKNFAYTSKRVPDDFPMPACDLVS
jgi:hypothetical protein